MAEAYSDAALRHFGDANVLAEHHQFDGAGHLIGFSVECAIKHAVAILRTNTQTPHVHLPLLIESAKKALQGRRQSSIRVLLERPNFMNGWEVVQRYYATGTITEEMFAEWRAHAQRALAAANLKLKAS